jgi:hypothetical protein
VSYEYRDDSARTLQIEQSLRAGGLAESQSVGEVVSIGDAEGYLQRNGSDTALLWARGDLVLRVSSNGLELDELLRVAESMRP